MPKPAYDFDKIKFATDERTFERAVGLYKSGKVTRFEERPDGYFAVVLGTEPYRVTVSRCHFDSGGCECYLGQRDTLCKHMVAVAMRAVTGGRRLRKDEEFPAGGPTCSGNIGELSAEELSSVRKKITVAMRHIKPYNGPSKIWFAYQDSLSEGCNRLAAIVSALPASEQTAKLLVSLLLQLDGRLCVGGVDDSDGTVGDFISETVVVLIKHAELDASCRKAFTKLADRQTCFGWEEPLLDVHGNQHQC